MVGVLVSFPLSLALFRRIPANGVPAAHFFSLVLVILREISEFPVIEVSTTD
jgi:hypothetical protein